MQHRERIRKITWAGTCLVFTSSILVLADTSSTAYAADPVRQDGYRHYAVYLSGKELRDGGDPGGWGMARVDFDAQHETACYLLTWDRLDGAVTDFHLHAGPRHNDGPHWIDFFGDKHFNSKDNSASGCVYSPHGKVLDIINDPSNYYFNVHTSAHKNGAIRGQLF
jgi:CHRD domain